MVDNAPSRILILGAHPDDAELFAGGFIVRHCRLGSTVKIISVTDGRSGHHEIPAEQLIGIRKREAAAAGERVGAEYLTWDFPDGSLEPDLKLRHAIIREIRRFEPDLVVTHRPIDYHPDHRAVGSAVQDASYLVTVPHVCDDVRPLRRDPVVGYMCDLFTRPNRLKSDVILDVRDEFDLAVQMAACHESQFFQWLPYHAGHLPQVPTTSAERFQWLKNKFAGLHAQRREHFQSDLISKHASLDSDLKIEVFEISEYAGELDSTNKQRLFPQAL